MSLWQRLRDRLGGRDGADEAAARADRAPPAAAAASRDRREPPPEKRQTHERPPTRSSETVDEIARLRRAGARDGPQADEVIATLRRVRGTLREADAVAQLLVALGDRPLPDPVRVACADLLAARGDEHGALRVLEGASTIEHGRLPRASGEVAGRSPAYVAAVSSTAGLILTADLYASIGQLPRAVGTIERVLAREIDAPGARERHQRWRAALGSPRAAAARLDEVTIAAPTAGRSPFRLLREVARGGGGAVYEAEDEVLGRRVGFKVYHGRGGERAQVEREVRLAAALAGPGVVRVYDADPADGWIALEWIARGSVRDILRAGDAAALVTIARWATPLAAALARIHDRGYVHADVKPANVLLRQPGEPVLSDFGLARPRGAPAAGGSPGYVSPERLAGRACDPRDDVYGYGRVLEDVLVRLDPLGVAGIEPWRALALRCVGRDDARPADGAALVRAIT